MSDATGFDLTAYLRRIGWDGPAPAPDRDSLRRLVLAHVTAIPFENLNPYLGLPVPLELNALAAKMVQGRRGGWCFEHNRLFQAVLEAVGFPVTGLAARVLYGQPEETLTPRTHMILRVDVGGEDWIADVGFGGLSPSAPLRMADGPEQTTPHEPYRLVEADGVWRTQARVEGEWRTLYRFDLLPAYAPDYLMANHFLCTHPSSHFLAGLGVARTTPGGRYALRGRELAIHANCRPSERRTLTVDEAMQALDDLFHIDVPEPERLRARLEG